MAGGKKREPIDLIIAKGRKHLTKQEIEERRAKELKVPFTEVEPPSYLTAKQKKEFCAIAEQLMLLNIMTELDVDVLAQYCIAESLYLEYSEQLKKILSKKNALDKWSMIEKIAANCEVQEDLIDLLETIVRRQRGDDATVIMNLQDKAFKQCMSCARELGLTITSRCKIVVPTPPDDEEDEL